jgi:hypothetical protein
MPTSRTQLPTRLPNDLILRQATAHDREALIRLQATAHVGPNGGTNLASSEWIRDLLNDEHPTVTPADTSVVEDPRTGNIVSSLTLVRQTWCYGAIPLGVGRVELVATDPAYRRRGLINRQLRLLHEWSAERGDALQAITDLMYFHGELGYHMALTQRAGRGGWTNELPVTPASGEPVLLRTATTADIPAFRRVDEDLRRRVLLSCLRDEPAWAYELTGRSAKSMVRDTILAIETPAARERDPIGYVVIGYGGIPTFPIPRWLPGAPCPEPVVSVSGFELRAGSSWLDIVPSVLRQVAVTHDGYFLWLGQDHPAYSTLDDRLVRRPPNVGWFIRVPDPAAFLTLVAPVLERRLSGSIAARFSGELRLHLYTYGLVLEFTQGRLTRVRRWDGANRRESDASLPEQMFVQQLLGHATFAELAPAFPDCRLQTATAAALLTVLFPKETSTIWPLA